MGEWLLVRDCFFACLYIYCVGIAEYAWLANKSIVTPGVNQFSSPPSSFSSSSSVLSYSYDVSGIVTLSLSRFGVKNNIEKERGRKELTVNEGRRNNIIFTVNF